jgi:hypothetical protein
MIKYNSTQNIFRNISLLVLTLVVGLTVFVCTALAICFFLCVFGAMAWPNPESFKWWTAMYLTFCAVGTYGHATLCYISRLNESDEMQGHGKPKNSTY